MKRVKNFVEGYGFVLALAAAIVVVGVGFDRGVNAAATYGRESIMASQFYASSDSLVGSWEASDSKGTMRFEYRADGTFRSEFKAGYLYYFTTLTSEANASGRWESLGEGRYKFTYESSSAGFTLGSKREGVERLTLDGERQLLLSAPEFGGQTLWRRVG